MTQGLLVADGERERQDLNAGQAERAVVDVGGQEPTREAASYVIGMSLLPALAHAAPERTQARCQDHFRIEHPG